MVIILTWKCALICAEMVYGSGPSTLSITAIISSVCHENCGISVIIAAITHPEKNGIRWGQHIRTMLTSVLPLKYQAVERGT
jgi:hypothetical protein